MNINISGTITGYDDEAKKATGVLSIEVDGKQLNPKIFYSMPDINPELEDFTIPEQDAIHNIYVAAKKQFDELLEAINETKSIEKVPYRAPVKLPKGCQLLAEDDKYVLAKRSFKVADQSRTEYVTWRKQFDGSVGLGHYFNENLQAAKEDFAKRSGLVNEDNLFNSDELAILYRGLTEYEKSETVDYDDKKLCGHFEKVRDKLESIPNVDINKYSTINVLVIEPNKLPYEKKILCELFAHNEVVGGHTDFTYSFDDSTVIISNTKGEKSGLPFNRKVNGNSYYGNFFIANMNERYNLTSLTPEQIKEYTKKFSDIESRDSFEQSVDKAVSEYDSNSIPQKDKDVER